MTDLKQIIDRMQSGGLTPDEVAEYRNHVAVWLYRYYEEKGQISSASALWLTANRADYKSQAEAERAWDAKEEGQRLIKVSNLIKGLEHIQDVLTSQYFALTRELKNT